MRNKQEIINQNIKSIYENFDQHELLPRITQPYLADKTDGTFTQVGLAFKVDDSAFDPEIPLYGLGDYGTIVAKGEVHYLIDFLSKAKKPERIELNSENLKKNLLDIMEFDPIGDSTFVLMQFGTETRLLSDRNFPIFWDSQTKGFVIDLGFKIKIYNFRKDIIGNNLLIINKNAILSRTLSQKNGLTNATTRLSVQTNQLHEERKIRFEIKTLLKLQIEDSKKFRLLEISNL